MGAVPVNTRFNPTISGPLHLGHLYNALICQGEAIAGGGKFVLRFDDTQAAWSDIQSPSEIEEYKKGMISDLQWAGVIPSVIVSQSEIAYETKKLLVLRCYEAGIPVPGDEYCENHFPEVIGMSGQQYPYTKYKTAEKVIMDRMQGITMLIRGWDLIGEFSLYNYFADMFRSYHPKQVFIPRLRLASGEMSAEVSKTAGNLKIRDFIERGIDQWDVIRMLSEACLIDPGQGWRIHNIKDQPVITRRIE